MCLCQKVAFICTDTRTHNGCKRSADEHVLIFTNSAFKLFFSIEKRCVSVWWRRGEKVTVPFTSAHTRMHTKTLFSTCLWILLIFYAPKNEEDERVKSIEMCRRGWCMCERIDVFFCCQTICFSLALWVYRKNVVHIGKQEAKINFVPFSFGKLQMGAQIQSSSAFALIKCNFFSFTDHIHSHLIRFTHTHTRLRTRTIFQRSESDAVSKSN